MDTKVSIPTGSDATSNEAPNPSSLPESSKILPNAASKALLRKDKAKHEKLVGKSLHDKLEAKFKHIRDGLLHGNETEKKHYAREHAKVGHVHGQFDDAINMAMSMEMYDAFFDGAIELVGGIGHGLLAALDGM